MALFEKWRTDKWWVEHGMEDPVFVYLAVERKPNSKVHSHVFVARRPKLKVDEHNATMRNEAENVVSPVTSSPKNGKKPSGLLTLIMILGPFPTKETAKSVKTQWVRDCRGVPSRKQKAKTLAKEHHVTLWDAELDSECERLLAAEQQTRALSSFNESNNKTVEEVEDDEDGGDAD
jgi:hypothetical protein